MLASRSANTELWTYVSSGHAGRWIVTRTAMHGSGSLESGHYALSSWLLLRQLRQAKGRLRAFVKTKV